MSCELIVYAVPTGPLAEQIAAYFAVSHELWPLNPAHAYMPHCSLTGFFHDAAATIPLYIQALDTVLIGARPTRPTPVIRVTGMLLHKDFHGLALESDWLKQLIVSFVQNAPSTRQEPLRRKDWLHLSFAYAFPAERAAPLVQAARTLVDPAAAVGWELRLYERLPDATWRCHADWPLSDATV